MNPLNFPTDKVGEIALFITTHDLDILAISESNLHGVRSRVMRTNPVNIHCINNALRIPGYHIILPDSWQHHHTARIFLYVRDSITSVNISTNVDSTDLPIIAVKAKKNKEEPTAVVARYREYTGAASGLSTTQAQAERLTRMLEIWRIVEQKGLDTIILGDINLDYKKWNCTGSQQQALIDQVKLTQVQATLTQMVKEDTRYQLVAGMPQSSMIDHMYTKCPDKIKGVEVVPVGDSDHQGQVVTKLLATPQERPQSYRLRQHKPGSGEALRQDLFMNNVEELILTCDTLKEAAEVFHREITYYAHKYMPIKTKQMRGNSKPFISDDTNQLIRSKHQALQIYKTTRDPANLDQYKTLTKQVQKAVAIDRKQWLKEDLREASSPKQAWRQARVLMGQGKSPSPRHIMIDGRLETNPGKMAEAFSIYHQDKIKGLRELAPTSPAIKPEDRLETWLADKNNQSPTFDFKPVTTNKVYKLLSRLKPGKAIPSDGIDAKTLKEAAPVIKTAIKHIINLSLAEGRFDETWKPQTIAPHHKKDDKAEMANYRPVSNIVEIGKLVEMEVSDQVIGHFTEHDLFHKSHHGSLPALDTTTALIAVQDFMINAAENKQLAATVFIDQSAAFDLVDHEILLKKT